MNKREIKTILYILLPLLFVVAITWSLLKNSPSNSEQIAKQNVVVSATSSDLENRLLLLEQKNKELEDKLSREATAKPSTEVRNITPTVPQKLTNAQIIAKTKPAVVYIETSSGIGTGMIISESGEILTNAHVVIGIDSADIKLTDGRSFPAVIVGRDEVLDVALLKINGANLPKITLANSSLVKQGDDVFTLGFPFGIDGDVSFKEGTISRTLTDDTGTYFETSAEIHHGNSGGPMVNTAGEVIAINTASYGLTVGGVQIGETIKFAIPINLAKSQLGFLREGGKALEWSRDRAFGVMTIYNKQSAPQRLIKNTRFESPEGVVFRITQGSVTVPAMKDGAPGMLSVTIFADETGAKYNIQPTTFKIPGIKGTVAYDLVYGQSAQAMVGGK